MTHQTHFIRFVSRLGLGLLSGLCVLPTCAADPGAATASWVGLIGVNYQPNHYSAGHVFNGHDVFFTGTRGKATPVTNVYSELAQLKAAGFTTIRSYQTDPYAWIDLIKQTRALGLTVVYEAAIPQSGSQADITTALQVLGKVIGGVGVTVFRNTVVLVLAGHENYSNTNVDYLKSAIQQLQTTLTTAGASTVPVGTALVSGNLVTPGSPADMQALISAASASAPLGFDPYPFQWGTWTPTQAANNAALINSIAWDYAQVKTQSFYTAAKPILMAETGWATAGSGAYAGYFCASQGNCRPGFANAAQYLQAVYGFVRKPANNAGVLVFEAYDEPAKDAIHADDAENYYGLFDTQCKLKKNNTGFLPNKGFVPTANLGCQGYTSGTLFSVVGTQQGSVTNQPPFKVEIQQTNPATSKNASMSVTVPKKNRTDASLNPWPYFLVFDKAVVKITGLTSGASCTFTAAVSAPTLGWGPANCTDSIKYPVNCQGNVCYLPWNNF